MTSRACNLQAMQDSTADQKQLQRMSNGMRIHCRARLLAMAAGADVDPSIARLASSCDPATFMDWIDYGLVMGYGVLLPFWSCLIHSE